MAAVIGSLRAELSASVAKFAKDMNSAADRVAGFSKRMNRMGSRISGVGRSMSLRLSAPVAAFGALTLRAAGDFEQAMNRVAAVSGATGDQLGRLRDQAKELGRTTQFSASEAADAMGFLAQAGFDAEKVMGTLPATLNLAAAAQVDLGSAADIASNVLQSQQFETSEMGRVTDVLTKAFTSANTDLIQLAEAMKFAGPVTKVFGIRFEEAAAALGLMGNAGIQASMAGTSLRGALAKLVSPSDKARALMESMGLNVLDAEGNMRPMKEILLQLERAFGKTAQGVLDANGKMIDSAEAIKILTGSGEQGAALMEIFGLRAGPAMAALIGQGSDALVKLTDDLDNSAGTAAKIGAVQMKGFNGAMRELKSAFEGLQIALADSGLLAFMTDLIKSITRFVQDLSKSNPEILKWGAIVGGLAVTVGPVLVAIGSLVGAVGTIVAALAPVGAAIAALSAGPLTLIVGAIAGVVLAWQNWDKIGPIVGAVYTAVKTWLVDKLGAVFDFVATKVKATIEWFRKMYQDVVGGSFVPDMIAGIADEFGKLPGIMEQPAGRAATAVSSAFEMAGDRVGQALQGMLQEGKFSLEGLARTGLQAVRDFAQQQASLSGKGGGPGGGGKSGGSDFVGLVGGFLNAFAGSFAGGFAAGGTIPRGSFGIVGEGGPELAFAGDSDMTVLPNGGGPPGGLTVNVFGVRDPDEFARTETMIGRKAWQAWEQGQRGR